MKEETAEQLAQLRAAYEGATDPKEKEKFRGRLRRAKSSIAEAAKATQEEINAIDTIEGFWAASLSGVNPEKLAGWTARQNYVEALLRDANMVLDGKQPDEEFVEDVDEEIQDDIREHGIAGITGPLLYEKFWLNSTMLAKFTNGPDTPTSIFARFGLVVGLPDFLTHKWNAFIAKHRGSNQPQTVPEVFYVSLRCSRCNGLPTSISSQIAAVYNRTNGYTCQSCIDKAVKARDFKQERYLLENANLLDSFGRVKDQAQRAGSK